MRLAPDLIEAVRLLGSRYHLLLVGPEIPNHAGPNISAFSRDVGAVELANLLADCDAFVNAGDAETFGLIVLEAMASGIPVVGVNAGATPELVGPEVGRLASSSAPTDLVAAVEALFEQDTQQVGRTARRAVETHWTWEVTLRLLFDTYLTMLDLPPTGSRLEHIHAMH